MADIEKDAKFLSESVSNLKIKAPFTGPEETYKDATKSNHSAPGAGNSPSPTQIKKDSNPFAAPDQVKEASNPFAAPSQVKESSNSFSAPSQVKEASNSFGAPSQVKEASNPFGVPTTEPNTETMLVNLSDIQGDENSPLYSAISFEKLGIDEKILKGIYAMNFKKPSKIQEKALPVLLQDPPSNMIAQSQSGTGKTAAFVITILSRLDKSMPEKPQALVLAPSRELARQIESVVRLIGKFMDNLTIQAAIPGALERSAQIKSMVVVGTPGTVLDLIRRRQLNTASLKILCLDEADNMLDMQGLGDQCLRVKSMLPSLSQILLFSATFPDQVWDYAREFSPKANEITLKKDNLTVRGVKQMFIDCPSNEGKYEILAQLYGMMTIGSSIIFVKRRETADKISERLMADGHQVVAVHGAYDGMDRDRILEDFRSGQAKVLITTNVLARGIDVSTVSMVINYDIPMKGRLEQEADPETYLHRIGRTGRFGRTGVSISFVFDLKSFKALSEIAEVYNIDLVRLNHEDWDQAEKVIQSIIKSSRKD